MSQQSQPTGYWQLQAAARLVRMSPGRVCCYVRAGLVQPTHVEGEEVLFGEAELARLRKIRRLSDDLGLNSPGVEVALHLLDEIEALRRQVDSLGAAPSRMQRE